MSGLAAAAPFAAAQANKKMDVPAAGGEGYIRQYYFDPKTQTVKPLEPVAAKDWGNTTFESRVPYLPPSQAASGGLQNAYANGGMAHFDEGGDTKAPTSVDQLYQQILGRAPENQQAQDYWNKQFGDTIEPDEVAMFRNAAAPELANSHYAEPQAPTPAQPSTPQYINDLYQKVLNRAPDEGGASYWAKQFGNELDPNELQDFERAAAPELNRNQPTGGGGNNKNAGMALAAAAKYFFPEADYVSAANNLIRGNLPGAALNAVSGFTGGLSSLGRSLGFADGGAVRFADGGTPQSVSDLYQQILGRAPEAAGLDYWNKTFGPTIDPNEVAIFKNAAAPELASTHYGQAPAPAPAAPAPTAYAAPAASSNTLTPDLAKTLMAQMMTTGLSNADVAKYGGYDAIKSMYDQGGGQYGLSAIAPADLQKYANTIAQTGVGNLLALEQTKTPLTAAGAAAMKANGIDPGAYAAYLSAMTIPKPSTATQAVTQNTTTNPYGNRTNPGDITSNAGGTFTVTPNIPNRPTGGTTGMGQLINDYTAAGGHFGQVLSPSKAYENTGASADIYKYLMGGAYPTQATGVGNNSRYYNNVAPSTTDTTRKMWINPKTNTYELNPNYVDPTVAAAAAAKTAAATDSVNTAFDPGGNGGTPFARGGSTQPFFSKSTGKFNYTGPKIYADGGISVGSRPDPNIDGQYQPPPDVSFQPTVGRFAAGGEAGYNLGGYSDGGRLLRGPGDGVSDSIPATIGHKQPARLADGEFVVPARIVSELGNGSTEAGARKLYAMMERVQQARGKTVGKGKVAKNSRADKYLPV